MSHPNSKLYKNFKTEQNKKGETLPKQDLDVLNQGPGPPNVPLLPSQNVNNPYSIDYTSPYLSGPMGTLGYPGFPTMEEQMKMQETQSSQGNISIYNVNQSQGLNPDTFNTNLLSFLQPTLNIQKQIFQCGGLSKTKKWNDYILLLFYHNPLWKCDINGENIFSVECEVYTDNEDCVCDKCSNLTQSRSFTSAMANVKRRIKNNPELDPKNPIIPVGSKNLTPTLRMIKDQITRPIISDFQDRTEKLKNEFELEKDKILKENKSLKRQLEKIKQTVTEEEYQSVSLEIENENLEDDFNNYEGYQLLMSFLGNEENMDTENLEIDTQKYFRGFDKVKRIEKSFFLFLC